MRLKVHKDGFIVLNKAGLSVTEYQKIADLQREFVEKEPLTHSENLQKNVADFGRTLRHFGSERDI